MKDHDEITTFLLKEAEAAERENPLVAYESLDGSSVCLNCAGPDDTPKYLSDMPAYFRTQNAGGVAEMEEMCCVCGQPIHEAYTQAHQND